MTEEHSDSQQSPGLLGALLSPLRAPERVIKDIERIASSLLSVESTIEQHLTSVDARAGALKSAVGALQDTLGALRSPLERIDRKVTQLAKLEQVITARMDELQVPLNNLDTKVTELMTLEQVITERMDTIDQDLNTRMLMIEQEVRALHGPIEQMATDVAAVQQLLPEPSDGPMARLKDTFTSA